MSENDRILSERRWTKRRLLFLLFPKVHLLDLAGSAQAFYEAHNLCNCPISISYASFGKAPIITEQQLGLQQLPFPSKAELGPELLICIPGIDFKSFQSGALQQAIDEARPWLKSAYAAGASIASICSGALILLEAGLLDNRKCTCHWKCMDYIKDNYPKAKLQSGSIYTEDRRIYTSAGMSTGIDLSLYLLEKMYGAFVAARVAQEMVVPFRREGGMSQENLYNQMKGGFHPAVFKAQEILLNHPQNSPSQEQLAAQVHLSARHLARLFKKYTGKTILEFRQEVRLELARQLLSQGQYTVKEVAGKCGYSTARQFRRVWKERYGHAPSMS